MTFSGDSETVAYSVIIPAYNAERTLSSCLTALADQSVPRKCYEIVVVDDGSIDATADIAGRCDVIYVYQTNSGPAAARNRGARLAKGALILFTDSDCVPDRDWIQEMVHPFRDPDVAGVKGAYKTKQKDLAARFAQAEFEDRYDLLQKSRYIDMVDTYAAAFRKEIFLKMGGFDQSFPVANNEDTDFSYRLAAAGHRLVFNPKAIVYHTHPDTLSKYLKVKFRRGFWRMVVYRRYPEKAVKDSYTPAVIKLQTLAMALSLVCIPLVLLEPRLLAVVLFSWGGILLSALPVSRTTYKRDKTVGLISPLVILLRSLVFAAGSMSGVVRSFILRGERKVMS